MNNAKTYALLFLLLNCFTWLSSCSNRAKKDCAKQLAEIHKGVSLEVAQSRLKECGFKTTFDPEKGILYGDRMKEGNPISERTQVMVKVDSGKNVTEVSVARGFIGP
jgi:hypothetical protein